MHEIRDQAGIIERLVDFYARIHTPAEAPGLVAAGDRLRCRAAGRGPAALECAIDVWGRAARSPPHRAAAARPRRAADRRGRDPRRRQAPRRGASGPLIVAGGGAQDAAAEVTELSRLLQAPVLAYRRGRGVLDAAIR